MAHLSRKHAFAQPARWAMAGIIAATAAVGPTFAQDRRRSELASSNPIIAATAMERTLDESLTRDPEVGALYAGIREVFPSEYRQVFSELVSQDPNDEGAAEAAFSPLAALVGKHEVAARDAPNANLVAVAEARLALLRAAKGDSATLCANIGSDIDYTDMTTASRRTRGALTYYVVTLLTAGKAGLDRPVERESIAEDLAAVRQMIVESGASQRLIDQIYGDRAPANAKESCAAAITLYEAMGRLPARQMAAIMAALLRDAGEEDESEAEAKVETALAENGFAQAFRATLQADFPEDYAAFRAEQVKAVEASGNAEDIGRELFGLVLALNAEHLADITRAGDAELLEVLKRRSAALRLLRNENVPLCGEFADSYHYEFAETDSDNAFSVVMAFELAYFRAIASGVKRPVSRPELDKSDLAALTDRLTRAGLGEDALMHLVGGEVDDLTEDQRCDMAIALHDAMATMPPRTSAALVARMMAKLAMPELDAASGASAN